MKGTEEKSAQALEKLLKELGFSCSWTPATPPNSFPDFDFRVEREQWAVECTELHQYIDQDGEALSRPAVDRSLERLCEKIRSQANAGSNRKYVISVFGPELQIGSEEIIRRALAYIESGRTEREALDCPEINESDVFKLKVKRRVAEDQARVHIQAFLAEVPIVWAIGLDGATQNADQNTLAANIHPTLRYAIQRILNDKLPKLAQCTNYQRKILLVWRGYFCADPNEVKTVLDEIHLTPDQLDSFLLVLPNGQVHWPADPGQIFSLPPPTED